MTNSSAVADLVTLASGVVFDPKKEVLVMGAPVKKSALTPERKDAMKMQANFDRAWLVYGSASRHMAEGLIYGDTGSPHSEALAFDANRSHSRFVFHVECLDRTVRFQDEKVATWRKKFDSDPAYAFECASQVAEAAAKAQVYRLIIALTLEAGPFKALDRATEEALRGARWPSHSTSPMANLMHEAQTAAWAEFVADNDRSVRRF